MEQLLRSVGDAPPVKKLKENNGEVQRKQKIEKIRRTPRNTMSIRSCKTDSVVYHTHLFKDRKRYAARHVIH